MAAPIVVIGAGALGSVVAARLGTVTDVQLLVRPAAAAAIAARGGLRIEGHAAGLYPIPLRTRFELPAGAVVVIAVKAYDLPSLLAAIAPHLTAVAQVVLLQNGLGIAAFARARLGREVVRAVTSLASIRLAPGHVRFITAGPTLFPAGTGLERLWASAGLPARAVTDLRPHVWRKLAVNAVINPLGALLGVENGRLLVLRHLPRLVVDEVVRVAGATGVPLHPHRTYLYVRGSMRGSAANRCSMLQDLRAGRPTEIDWLNGAVVRAGERAAIPVPGNGALTRLVRARALASLRGAARSSGHRGV